MSGVYLRTQPLGGTMAIQNFGRIMIKTQKDPYSQNKGPAIKYYVQMELPDIC